MFLWVDFFNTYEDRTKAYTAEAWTPYLEKFNSQDILEPVSYQMTSLDDIDPGDYIVQVWVWDPKKGKAAETLEALEEAKTIFEKHGFLIDLWQHGLGSKNYYQFLYFQLQKKLNQSLFHLWRVIPNGKKNKWNGLMKRNTEN